MGRLFSKGDPCRIGQGLFTMAQRGLASELSSFRAAFAFAFLVPLSKALRVGEPRLGGNGESPCSAPLGMLQGMTVWPSDK